MSQRTRTIEELESELERLRERLHRLESVAGPSGDIQAELDKDIQAARRARDAKHAFLMSVTAEMRTGLQTFLGMTELVLGTELTAKQREDLQVMRSSADTLAASINNLVDLSSIEAGKFDMDPIPFHLRDSLGYTMGGLALRAHEQGVDLVSHILEHVPDHLIGDPGVFRQLVAILIGQAVRQTGAGGVVILRIEVEERTGQDVLLHLSVIQSAGAAAQERGEALFEPTGLAGTASTHSRIVPVVWRLVELSGGRVWADEPSQGETTVHFTVRFRLASAPIERLLPADPEATRGMRVLVADHHVTNRYILTEMLRCWEFEPVGVDTAYAALLTLERAADEGRPFDLVLLESTLPDGSGFALAERVRRQPRLAATRLMMLTSAGSRGDAARCRGLGIAAYLTRPVRQGDLFDAMMTVLGALPAQAGAPVLVTRHSLREGRRIFRILVVEESIVNVQLAGRVMERQGHGVLVATSALEARSSIEQQPFDLILLDLQMPGLDPAAFITAARQRARDQGRGVTIIGTTTHPENQMTPHDAQGMNCYLLKPFHARVLQDLLDDLGRPAMKEQPQPLPRRATDEPDVAEILSRVDGDLKLLTELVRLFLGDCPRLVGELRDAAARGDAAALQAAAHRLHASVLNFSAQTAGELAWRLEAMAKDGRLDGAEQLCTALERELGRLAPALKRLSKRDAAWAS